MNEMTAGEVAENLERLAKDFEEVGTPGNARILRYSASILRRVASGELAEVVHCGECKFLHITALTAYCPIMNNYPAKDFYCGAGERKDGEK
jgi:hypothetical protein